MPYLVSLLVILAGVVVLLVLAVRLAGPVRRLRLTAALCRAYLADRVGLLTARIAGLRVELDRRRRQPRIGHPDSRHPRSIDRRQVREVSR